MIVTFYVSRQIVMILTMIIKAMIVTLYDSFGGLQVSESCDVGLVLILLRS